MIPSKHSSSKNTVRQFNTFAKVIKLDRNSSKNNEILKQPTTSIPIHQKVNFIIK